MAYFQNFPYIYYDLSNSTPSQPIIVKNIMARAKIKGMFKNNSYVYYTYQIKPSDTPEIIAYKYYGDSNRHWIILLANDIVNPFYDWPLFDDNFTNFIVSKYGSVAQAMEQIDHYQKSVVKTDTATGIVTEFDYTIDQTTYNALPAQEVQNYSFPNGGGCTVVTTTSIVYSWDYESALNTQKQTIKIIDASYVAELEAELKSLLNS